MKKATIITAAFVVLFTGTIFAKDPVSLTPEVKAAFLKTFEKAENVTWKLNSGVYFAQFTLNDKPVTASFNQKGELTGTSRWLDKSELPLAVSIELKKSYSDYEIGQINEITANGETNYFFTATNKKFELTVKSDSEGSFTIENRVKK